LRVKGEGHQAGPGGHQAQAKLYESTAEVGRLEAEIRYVVEGRQRVQQRLVSLAEQMAQWSDRKDEAEAELLVNSLSMALPLEVQDKQALLEAATLPERRELLEGLLEYELRGGEHDEVMQ